jgi:hypothetical protein
MINFQYQKLPETRRLTCEVYDSQHVDCLDGVDIHKVVLAEDLIVNLAPCCIRIAFNCFFLPSLEEWVFGESASCCHKR